MTSWTGRSEMPSRRRSMLLAATLTIALLFPASTIASAPCVGDCDGTGTVEIAELVRQVSIALKRESVQTCVGGDVDADGEISVDELVAAANSALSGCSTTTPIPTPTISIGPLPTANMKLIEKCGRCDSAEERRCKSRCIDRFCSADTPTVSQECRDACFSSCEMCEEGSDCSRVVGRDPVRVFVACIELDRSDQSPPCLEEFPGQ